MSNELTPQGGDTAADLKMKIEKLQAQRAEAKGHPTLGAPLADGKTPAPSNSNPESNNGKSAQASAGPQAQPAPGPKSGTAPLSKYEADLQEWAKSKGIDWTSESSVLEALRKSDQEYHKRRQEKAKEAPVAPAPNYQPQPPQYGTPPTPQARLPRESIAQIARQYNMAYEDAERLIAFNNDFVDAKLTVERQQLAKEFDQLKKANTKNDIFRELSSDPTFRNPQVQYELHRTLGELQERDPRAFEEDPNVYREAYKEALANIARRNLQGDVTPYQNQANSFMPPSNPPRPIGNGGTGETQKENELSQDQFASLSVDEQRALLGRMGLISAKY